MAIFSDPQSVFGDDSDTRVCSPERREVRRFQSGISTTPSDTNFSTSLGP